MSAERLEELAIALLPDILEWVAERKRPQLGYWDDPTGETATDIVELQELKLL